jgi:histone acetyltransferase (RNA polymerase elongator complex component)
MPKSYLTLEPATLRAKRNNFDCVQQMYDRMNSLYMTGHGNLSKIEVCILGGTFSHYPNKYREEFVRDLYYAANTFWERNNKNVRPRMTLDEEKNFNDYESSCKVVQVVIETRPDCITFNELRFLRYLSVTRIQLGIQHLDDEVLNKNNRGCPTKTTLRAIERLKMIGMKIDGHFMPNMPFSTVEKDREMLNEIVGLRKLVKHEVKYKRSWYEFLIRKKMEEERWEYYDVVNEDIQVDQLKIYPTAVTVYTDIEKWYKSGEYVPYDESYLVDMLLNFKALVFPWIRLNRIMRDFYADNIYSISGSNLNMRSELHKILRKEGKRCMCIRCREAKLNEIGNDYVTVVRTYKASGGREYFISAESRDSKILYGFVRLRLDNEKNKMFHELNGCALLREAHVYSTVTEIGKKGKVQHKGLGTFLMGKAESIAKENGYEKMAVIAAVGSRGFYRKLGYALHPSFGEYMIKKIVFK